MKALIIRAQELYSNLLLGVIDLKRYKAEIEALIEMAPDSKTRDTLIHYLDNQI